MQQIKLLSWLDIFEMINKTIIFLRTNVHDKLFLADILKKYLNSRYIPWLHRQQRRIPLRLVIDGHVSVLTRAADAGDDAGEVGAGGGVGVLQAVKRGVLRLGAFVAVGAGVAGAGSSGRRAGRATASATGAIALQLAASGGQRRQSGQQMAYAVNQCRQTMRAIGSSIVCQTCLLGGSALPSATLLLR